MHVTQVVRARSLIETLQFVELDIFVKSLSNKILTSSPVLLDGLYFRRQILLTRFLKQFPPPDQDLEEKCKKQHNSKSNVTVQVLVRLHFFVASE